MLRDIWDPLGGPLSMFKAFRSAQRPCPSISELFWLWDPARQIWTDSSGRGQKFMLKRSLGPRDHTGMLSDQLRSAGHLWVRLLQLRPIQGADSQDETAVWTLLLRCQLHHRLQKSCASASYRASAVCCPIPCTQSLVGKSHLSILWPCCHTSKISKSSLKQSNIMV